MKFIMFRNGKMPTIVGILKFIGIINTISESLKAGKVFIFQYFGFYGQLKVHAQLSCPLKQFNILKDSSPGHVVQSVTCLATDASLTADPGVASSIQARSHTWRLIMK